MAFEMESPSFFGRKFRLVFGAPKDERNVLNKAGPLLKRHVAWEWSPDVEPRIAAGLRAMRSQATAEEYSGLARIAARKAVDDLPMSTKLDFIRNAPDPEYIKEVTKTLQANAVAKYAEDPSSLGYGEIFERILRDIGSADPAGAFVGAVEAPKRSLDYLASRVRGEGKSFGQHQVDLLKETEGWKKEALKASSFLGGPVHGVAANMIAQGRVEEDGLTEKYVSGSMDAALLVGLDPSLMLGKVQNARYLARVPNAARTGLKQVLSSKGVERWVEWAAKSDDPVEVFQMARSAKSFLPMDAAQKIAKTRNPERITAILGEYAPEMTSLPHFGWMGAKPGQTAKWAKDAPLTRQFTPIWAEYADVYSPRFWDDVNHMAQYFHPKDAAKWVDDIHKAGSGPARLEKIDDLWRSGLSRQLQDAGVDEAKATELISTLRTQGGSSMESQAFMGDIVGLSQEVPILGTQARYQMGLPNYRDVRRLTKAAKGMKGKAGKALDDFAEMTQRRIRTWWLVRPAYISKNALEDMATMVSHPQYGGFALRQVGEAFSDIFSRAIISGGTYATEKGYKVAGAPKVVKMLDAQNAKILGKAEDAASELPELLRSTKVYSQMRKGYMGPVDDLSLKEAKAARQGGMNWFQWSYHQKGTIGHETAWHHFVNHQFFADEPVKVYLANFDGDRIAAVSKWLSDNPAFLDTLPSRGEDLGRWTAPEYAKAVDTLFNYVVPKPLHQAARKGHLSRKELRAYANIGPEKISGPAPITHDSRPAAFGAILDTAEQKFFGLAGWMMDELIRRPGFTSAYKKEVTRLKAMADDVGAFGRKLSLDDIEGLAHRNVTNEFLAYLDNPLNRTRGGEVSRAWVAFGDAHIRFVRRWARIAKTNYQKVEQARLMFGAGENLGWIQTDENGNQVVQMPVAPELANLVLKTIHGEAAEGIADDWFRVVVDRAESDDEGVVSEIGEQAGDLLIPKGVPFGVEVIPGLMPIVTLPLDWLALKRPSLRFITNVFMKDFQQKLSPEEGVATNVLASVQSGWMEKMGRAFFGSDRDLSFANSQKDAFAYLVHKKEWDPKDPATIEKAESIAKSMWFMRGLSQSFSPYTPTQFPFAKEQMDDWHEMRTELGPEYGLIAFVEKHGDSAEWFTFAKTKAKEGEAPWAMSDESLEFYRENRAFAEEHSEVAGYFSRDLESDFSYNAYRVFFQEGKRTASTMKDWVADAMFSQGQDVYYDQVRPAYEEARKKGASQKDLRVWLAEQKAKINDEYPGWLEGRARMVGVSNQKRLDIDRLRVALDDETVKDFPATAALKEWFPLYDSALERAEAAGYQTLRADKMEPVRVWLRAHYDRLNEEHNSRGFTSAYQYLWRAELQDFEEE